jgi:hypothetical protein
MALLVLLPAAAGAWVISWDTRHTKLYWFPSLLIPEVQVHANNLNPELPSTSLHMVRDVEFVASGIKMMLAYNGLSGVATKEVCNLE